MKHLLFCFLLLLACPAFAQVTPETFPAFVGGVPGATLPLASGDKVPVIQGGVTHSIPGTSVGAQPSNPTATAGPTAVNGTATTFMRSDGAPAVQTGSTTQQGIVQCDGVSITCTAGVIAAPGAGTGTAYAIVLKPSKGGSGSDYTAVQNALNSTAQLNVPVVLEGGVFDVCQELVIPAKGLLIGESARSGGDISFASSAGPPATRIECTGSWSGNAHVALAGEYASVRGLAIHGINDGASFTGSISGTTLTTTTCNVLRLGQGFNDDYSAGPAKIIMGTIVTAVGTCSSGTQTYTINQSQTVSSETMTAATACLEVINNASWTTISDFWFSNCSGDGYRVVPDSTKSGFQNTNGLTGRPNLYHGQIFNNQGSGINFVPLQTDGSANVTDVYISDVDMGANGGDGIEFQNHTGGQVQLHNLKIDFNIGRCMTLSSAYYTISDIICDNDYGFPAPHYFIWTDLQAFNNDTYLQMANVDFIDRDATTPIGIYFNSDSDVALTGLTNSNIPSLFQVGPNGSITSDSKISAITSVSSSALYADTATALAMEPFFQPGGAIYNVPAIATNTFTPSFTGGKRDFEIDFPATCSPSPCVIASPVYVPPGLKGTMHYVQPLSGSASTAPTFGAAFYKSTLPTLTGNLNAHDTQEYTTDKTGHIILKPLQTDLFDGPQVVQTATTSIAGPVAAGTLGSVALSGVASGDTIIVRVYLCGIAACGNGAFSTTVSNVSSTTTPTCTRVDHILPATFVEIEQWACQNQGAGAQTLTVTTTGGSSYLAKILAVEIKRTPTTSVDGTVANTNSQTSNILSTITLNTGSLVKYDLIFSSVAAATNSFAGPGAPAGFQVIEGCDGVSAYCDSVYSGAPAGVYAVTSTNGQNTLWINAASGYLSQ